MEMNYSPPLGMPPDLGGRQVSPSFINLYRIMAVVDRLSSHVQPNSNQSDTFEFFNLCLSLSRGIDYALANGEIPPQVNELPMLMKQIYHKKKDEISQAAVMVLMISVKNACKIGWFETKDSEELLTIADELGKVYCTLGNISTRPSSCNSTVATIMERFYPRIKLGPILVSIEAKPGYGASAVDFHITKNKFLPDKKIWLLVAQTDNIETSACLISPQEVNFLLNGKGIDARTNVRMDPGPQMPTNVTSMLKYGTNLLQAVGQFNGHYTILVAYINATSLLEHPVLEDYVQPAITSVDSDPDIIEGPSRISLNCPISFTRIKTPVKGHSCKHFQCFDFDNFINMNFKRPSWRCPRCNQSVCYTDIRLDRNMIEILKNVGENIVEVIINADGSWKTVSEDAQAVDNMQNKARDCEKEQTEPRDSTCSPNSAPDVLDLTNDDSHLDIMDTCATADKKPVHDSVSSQFVTPNSTSFSVNSTGVNQNVAAQIDGNCWADIYVANSRPDTRTIRVSEHPILPDTVSPAVNQEAEGHANIPAMNSAMCNQFSAPSNTQLLNYMHSLVDEYQHGRSSSAPQHIGRRTSVGVEVRPIQSQASGLRQSSITNLDSLLTSSSPATPHVPLSNPASPVILSDAERQQFVSLSSLNSRQISGVGSSTPTLQHQSATQIRVPPVSMSAPTQLQNPYRAPARLNEIRNPQLQQALNPQQHHPMQASNTTHRSYIQQGGSQARTLNGQQARVMASSQVSRQGERRPVQLVSRTDELFNSPPDQNWRPAMRMRGSLMGQPLSDDIRQRIIAPTQAVQSSSSRPQGPQPVRTSSSLDVLIANNRNAHNNSPRP